MKMTLTGFTSKKEQKRVSFLGAMATLKTHGAHGPWDKHDVSSRRRADGRMHQEHTNAAGIVQSAPAGRHGCWADLPQIHPIRLPSPFYPPGGPASAGDMTGSGIRRGQFPSWTGYGHRENIGRKQRILCRLGFTPGKHRG